MPALREKDPRGYSSKSSFDRGNSLKKLAQMAEKIIKEGGGIQG